MQKLCIIIENTIYFFVFVICDFSSSFCLAEQAFNWLPLRFPWNIFLYPFVLMYSCTHVLMSSCPHVLLYSCPHVLMSSCSHVLMCSCPHVLMSSCPHVLMSSCAHVLMYSCNWLTEPCSFLSPSQTPCWCVPIHVCGRGCNSSCTSTKASSGAGGVVRCVELRCSSTGFTGTTDSSWSGCALSWV